MLCSMATGSCSQHMSLDTSLINKCRILLKVFAFRNIIKVNISLDEPIEWEEGYNGFINIDC